MLCLRGSCDVRVCGNDGGLGVTAGWAIPIGQAGYTAVGIESMIGVVAKNEADTNWLDTCDLLILSSHIFLASLRAIEPSES